MNVYVLDISPLRGREREALALLSAERREKALRIRREEARLQSIGAGLLLRRASLCPPFFHGEHGKPYSPEGPWFSLSHSGTLAALAVNDAPVGLDVERVAPLRRAADRVLMPEERRFIQTDAERRFAYLWTRKEAALKCTGAGLSIAMNTFSALAKTVSINGEPLALYTVEYGDYMLSTAVAARSAVFIPQRVEASELLRGDALWN